MDLNEIEERLRQLKWAVQCGEENDLRSAADDAAEALEEMLGGPRPTTESPFYVCGECGSWINTKKYVGSPHRKRDQCPACGGVMLGCADLGAVASVLNSRQVGTRDNWKGDDE